MPPNDSGAIPGARDVLEPELVALQDTQRRLQDFLSSWGYRQVDVPLLERTDLYLRKLGSQVAALLFTLTDHRGERLSLRPEFTGSVIRSYIEHAGNLPLPVRWQYSGAVFRDQDSAGGQLRQFTQLGAELIGADNPQADAELISLAARGAQTLELQGLRIVLGHAGLVTGLLSGLALSDRARGYLSSHMELVRRGPEGVQQLRKELNDLYAAPLAPTTPERSETEAGEGEASSLMSWLMAEDRTRTTGRRTSEEIVQRFREKVLGADSPQQIDRALELAAELAAVRAAPAAALAQGADIVQRYRLDPAPLARLEAVVQALSIYDLGDATIELDLGLTRSLGYYTGAVFELLAANSQGETLGGGGRYDGLVRALGAAEDVPALGFAYTLETLHRARGYVISTDSGAPAALVVAETAADLAAAVRHVDRLRAQGQAAVLELAARSEVERARYCRDTGIPQIIVISGEEILTVTGNQEGSYAPAGTP